MNAESPATTNRPVRRRRRLYETTDNDNASMEAKPFKKKFSAVTPAAELAEESADASRTDETPLLEETPSTAQALEEVLEPATESTSQAISAPFSLKAQEAEKIVRDHVWWSATLGLIPIPVLDFIAITGVQVKMLHRLCDYYQQPFSDIKAKVFIAALLGGSNAGFIGVGLSRSLGKFIPLVGFVSMPLAAGALTYAIGRVFIHHFELGGTFLSFDVEKMREHFAQERQNAQNMTQNN